MKFWVGITDRRWFEFLAARPELDEVNFWQPRGGRPPVRLDVGAPFLFKLHAADGGWIVGGGSFLHWTSVPIRLAWDAFGEKNGADSVEAMAIPIRGYRGGQADIETDEIGCMMLGDPWFLPREAWIGPPSDWSPNLVQGRTYDTEAGAGAVLWQQAVSARAQQALVGARPDHKIGEDRYGSPTLVTPRLGQGTFRLWVTDAYERRCTITGERTLPVLEAAHIKPYSLSGPHAINNGLLLRSDLHTLFDRGYITVDAQNRVRVSRRIREEWLNGRDYYAFEGRELREPTPPQARPAAEYLEWHRDVCFRG
jgi:putative restriction endonuclease